MDGSNLPAGFSQAAYDRAHTLPAVCEDCAASAHGCTERHDECGGPYSMYKVTIEFRAVDREEADVIAYELWRNNAPWYNEHRASLGDAEDCDGYERREA